MAHREKRKGRINPPAGPLAFEDVDDLMGAFVQNCASTVWILPGSKTKMGN